MWELVDATHEARTMAGTDLVPLRAQRLLLLATICYFKKKKLGCLKTKQSQISTYIFMNWKKYVLAWVSGRVWFKGVTFTSVFSWPTSQSVLPCTAAPSFRQLPAAGGSELISLLTNNAPNIHNPLKCIHFTLGIDYVLFLPRGLDLIYSWRARYHQASPDQCQVPP